MGTIKTIPKEIKEQILKRIKEEGVSVSDAPRKIEDEGKEESKWKNEIIGLCPIRPNIIWASDFTYIKFMGSFIYLATIIDVFTREIIGWNISVRHDTQLVMGTLKHAIERTGAVPIYLHSDQMTQKYMKTLFLREE